MWIYKITNRVNGKIYIGQTHYDNPSYFGSGILIKGAIKKYGIDNFEKIYIDTANDQIELDEKEKHWIKFHSSQDHTIGYNIADGGYNCFTMTDDVAKKISSTWKTKYEQGYINNRIGTIMSDEVKDKISNSNKGKIRSDETKNKISSAHLGKILSDETRKKLSISHTGKSLSEEHKASISQSLIGRLVSDETKLKLHESNINKTQKHSKKVIATNILTNEILNFNNISQASRFFNTHRSYIRSNKVNDWNITLHT